MDITMSPVVRHGKQTMPITYDSNCLEEICGSCAMRINGRGAMACSSLIDKQEQPIRLEPLWSTEPTPPVSATEVLVELKRPPQAVFDTISQR